MVRFSAENGDNKPSKATINRCFLMARWYWFKQKAYTVTKNGRNQPFVHSTIKNCDIAQTLYDLHPQQVTAIRLPGIHHFVPFRMGSPLKFDQVKAVR